VRIVNIEYRDVYVTLDFSLKQLKHLRDLFNHADISYDGENEPEMKEAVDFLNNQFHPFLVQVVKDNESNLGE